MTPRLRHFLTAFAAVLAIAPQLALDLPTVVDAGVTATLVFLAAYGIVPPPRRV